MVHEEVIIRAGPAGTIDCLQCGRRSAPAHLLERIRKPYYFGIPLGTEIKVMVVCDVCKAEHLTRAKSFDAFLQYRPDNWNAQVTGLNSPLFPQILIIILLLGWYCPLVGPVIYFFLMDYRQYIRGKWRMLYRLMAWPTLVANLFFMAIGVYENI